MRTRNITLVASLLTLALLAALFAANRGRSVAGVPPKSAATVPTAAPHPTPVPSDAPTPGPDYDGKGAWDGWTWVIRTTTYGRQITSWDGSVVAVGQGGSSAQYPISGVIHGPKPDDVTVTGCTISVAMQQTNGLHSWDNMLRLQLLGGGRVYGDVQTTMNYNVISLAAHSPLC